VKQFIQSRWPDIILLHQHSDCSQLESSYRCCKFLTTEQESVLLRKHVAIPSPYRTKVINLLHQGHTGIHDMWQLLVIACTGHEWIRLLKKWFVCVGLVQEQLIKKTCHMSLVASINKTLVAYPQTTLVHIWDGTSSWTPM